MSREPGGAADLAFVSGAVYTVDGARRTAQAVAVRGGRIVAVGTDAAIRDHVGTTTEVVNLGAAISDPTTPAEDRDNYLRIQHRILGYVNQNGANLPAATAP